MAAKLTCPGCSRVLKELGDEMKSAQGEYRVYDSLWNSKEEKGTHRRIECLGCGHMGPVLAFESF